MYEGGFTYLFYRKPLLYDLAFSWSTSVEVDFYEAAFEEHAGGAEKVLELGCGNRGRVVEKYLFTYRWSGGKSLTLYGMMIMCAWELSEVVAAARKVGLEPVACYSDFSLDSRIELDEPRSRVILVLRRPVG